MGVTLPETNIASENGWLEDDPFLLGRPIFRCYVSFREGITPFITGRVPPTWKNWCEYAVNLPGCHTRLPKKCNSVRCQSWEDVGMFMSVGHGQECAEIVLLRQCQGTNWVYP